MKAGSASRTWSPPGLRLSAHRRPYRGQAARNVLDFLKLIINKEGALHMGLQDDIVAACLVAHEGTVKRMSIWNNWRNRLPRPANAAAWLLAAGGAMALGGCAPIPAGPAEYSAGRTRVVLPSAEWEDLGVSDEALPQIPQPGSFALRTRAVALRGASGELLAVMLVQTNRSDIPRNATLWTGACPAQEDVFVRDATAGSPVRIDCLRFKRWANNRAGWLEKNYPDVARWMSEHKAVMAQPYSHLNYRFATQGGSYLQINAMVDQRLLTPKVRHNEEFLDAGRPAYEWSAKVAEAARVSTGMVDGFFAVPPFPYPAPR